MEGAVGVLSEGLVGRMAVEPLRGGEQAVIPELEKLGECLQGMECCLGWTWAWCAGRGGICNHQIDNGVRISNRRLICGPPLLGLMGDGCAGPSVQALWLALRGDAWIKETIALAVPPLEREVSNLP